MNAQQLKLFEYNSTSSFQNRSQRETTFKGNLIEPVHRWFRLTPSFAPQLVRDIFLELNLQKSQRVIDPYCGTATVAVEAQRCGTAVVGVEINPALHFVSEVKTKFYEPLCVQKDLDHFLSLWQQALAEINEPSAYLEFQAEFVPKIAYPERWWAIGTMAQLVAARLVLAQSHFYYYPQLVRFAIGSIVTEVSMAKHNHPSMSFADGRAVEKDAVPAYQRKCEQILEDIYNKPVFSDNVKIYPGNTKNLVKVLAQEEPFDLVVTSPPYPNRFSYARETRPFLFFLDLVKDAGEVGNIEIEAMGGTWGKATWILQKEVIPANPVLARLLKNFIGGMSQANPILKHYVIHYFNDLWLHVEQINQVMKPKAQMAWVVGNAVMSENEIATDEYLVAILNEFGWKCDGIEHLRKRHSKRGLHESVVFLSRALN